MQELAPSNISGMNIAAFSSPAGHNDACKGLLGHEIGAQFAQRAISSLPEAQLEQLMQFLDAELGIILHCQSKEGDASVFGDEDNQTIQLLKKKGFSEQFDFCYDWHWRSEDVFRGRGRCPTTKWDPKVKRLHDDLSSDLLRILSFRFLIVGGSCAKTHYRSIIAAERHSVPIHIVPGLKFEIDFEFTGKSLQRIVTYIDHPSILYFHPSSASASSQRFDAACNFFLWLVGRSYDPIVLNGLELTFSRRPRNIVSAPIAELWRYISLEREMGKILMQEEYDSSFWTWAKQFLGGGSPPLYRMDNRSPRPAR
ncbi:hypothetical protein DL762_000760 [Monosporascus cannonballus]|uniref:Uncharacterized protein n=1 Tax=Monosporascus cannonballus TaxID=155416 RepID=A0ABY0HI67_9PEZI|nr:hypothetical protein DL762_000760 [Monosporascus cannonballus]